MTLSDRLRAHALGPLGKHTFVSIDSNEVFAVVRDYCYLHEHSGQLTPDERRMFILFVAEAIES